MTGSTLLFDHFDSVSADGGGGHDTANLNDSGGNDHYVLAPTTGSISNNDYTVNVGGFERINAFSKTGLDTVDTFDSDGNDVFFYRDQIGVLSGDGYLNYTQGFAQVQAYSSGGDDVARIFDTAGNDQFTIDASHAELNSRGLQVSASRFRTSTVIANQGGVDQALIQGTEGADLAHVGEDSIRVELSNGRVNQVFGAERVQLDMLSGHDVAMITGTGDRDVLKARYDEVEFETTLQMLRMTNLERTEFDGNGGADEVIFDEVGELDLLESLGDQATIYLRDHSVKVEDFAFLEARTVDNAIADYDLEAVDYLYMLRGQWTRRS
jgi:hypothetical protein